MNSVRSLTPGEPVLVYFQEIKAGDLRKFKAVSNDDPAAGGGARDLRVPQRYAPLLGEMFDVPGDSTGTHTTADVNVAPDQGPIRSHKLEFWRPTDARAVEWRIARVHALELAIDETEFKKDLQRGFRTFFVLMKDERGRVWMRLFRERHIAGEDPRFREYVRTRIAKTSATQSVRGTIRWAEWQVYP